MAVKYIDSNKLLTVIKTESIYVIARNNMDSFCRYVTVDQDDSSAKKSVSVFEKMIFFDRRQNPQKLGPCEYKKIFNASIYLQILQ